MPIQYTLGHSGMSARFLLDDLEQLGELGHVGTYRNNKLIRCDAGDVNNITGLNASTYM